VTQPRRPTSHAQRNRATWNADADDYQARHEIAQRLAAGGPGWGSWNLPESELHVLGEVAGRDVLELGCGAAQWSIALARAGARVVGLDLSERQLRYARRLAADMGVEVPLLHADAEAVPLAAAGFDVVFCDHGGAMNFADRYQSRERLCGAHRAGIPARGSSRPPCGGLTRPRTLALVA
jgi:SAM-dependent methyltransferase